MYSVETDTAMLPLLSILVQKRRDAAVLTTGLLESRDKVAVPTAELTRTGITALRDDGSPWTLSWRDVIDVAVRRCPIRHETEVCIDVIPASGPAMRLLPWTELTGTRLNGAGSSRARLFVAFVRTYSPSSVVDPPTRGLVYDLDPLESLPRVELAA
jgi:hypothetical protein